MVSSTDVQKLFLQAVISRRFLSTNLAKVLWQKSVETVKDVDPTVDVTHGDDTDFENFVNLLNGSINGLDLEFVRLHDEETGREMRALVNRRDDETAQIATDFTPVEIAYFKALVDEIMLAPNDSYSISSLAAMRDNPKPSTMSKSQAETVLMSFVARGWLLKSKKGRFSLSTRTLLELQPYIKSTYPEEIFECVICLEILTRGIGCYRPNCKVRIHPHCYNKWKAQSPNPKCPTCSEDWSREASIKKLIPIGEKAAGPDDHRKLRRKSTVEASEDEDEGVQLEEDEPSQKQTNGRRNTRGASTRGSSAAASQVDDSMDAEEEETLPPKRTTRRRG